MPRLHRLQDRSLPKERTVTLPTRMLGDGLNVSALGLGCMGMSGSYGTRDEAESMATLRHALDRGLTFIDTADVYGANANEELVGRAIAGRRDDVVLATKFGLVLGDDGRPGGVDGRPEHAR